MSKFCSSFVGLFVIGATIGVTIHPSQATPAPATSAKTGESKAAQCKRFDKALTAYYAGTPSELTQKDDINTVLDKVLKSAKADRQTLQSIKFTDPTILKIRQSILNTGIDLDQGNIKLRDALIRHDAKALRAINSAMMMQQINAGMPAYEYCQLPLRREGKP
jgi:hypothetical protein